MKSAIYIDDGRFQIVLTPGSEFEKKLLAALTNKSISCHIETGSFYDCQGDWTRHTYESDSLIIVVDRKEKSA